MPARSSWASRRLIFVITLLVSAPGALASPVVNVDEDEAKHVAPAHSSPLDDGSPVTPFSAGPVGLAGSASMGLSVGLLAAAAALYAVRENPELRDDFRPIAQPITGVLATASAVSLFGLGAMMLALDIFWLSAAPEPMGQKPHTT